MLDSSGQEMLRPCCKDREKGRVLRVSKATEWVSLYHPVNTQGKREGNFKGNVNMVGLAFSRW